LFTKQGFFVAPLTALKKWTVSQDGNREKAMERTVKKAEHDTGPKHKGDGKFRRPHRMNCEGDRMSIQRDENQLFSSDENHIFSSE
jgi:hypothetical protein